MRKLLRVLSIATLSMVALQFQFAGSGVFPAYASTNTLTVVSSGGAAAGSGWSYNSSNGQITITANVSINASDVEANLVERDLVLIADRIRISADITSNTARSLTLRAIGNINVDGGIKISTNGGHIIFQSNSSDSGIGSIRLGGFNDTTTGEINSNGGDIILSGGSNPATGFAMASTDISPAPDAKPAAGVAAYGFKVNASGASSGGNIVVRASSGPNTGPSTRSLIIESNKVAGIAGRQSFETSHSGNISIIGDAKNLVGNGTAWGMNINGGTFVSEDGNISLIGEGNNLQTGDRGIVSANATFSSSTGNITLADLTEKGSGVLDGMYFSSTNGFTTGGEVLIQADAFRNDGTLTLNAAKASITSYRNSFVSALSILSTIVASNCQDLTFGKPGNEAAITFSNALTVDGPLTVHAGNIAINGAVGVGSSDIFLYSSGSVTQSAALTADGLALIGTGASFTLENASNNVRVLAGGSINSRLGAIKFLDASGGLIIGQVGSISGLHSSGLIEVATSSGNLTIQNSISSTASSGDTVKFYANKTGVSGSAGNGDVLVLASGSMSINENARALLYSGSRTTSTGLVNFVGGETNARSLVVASTSISSISPALGATGKFALFRTDVPSPSYTITYVGNANTSGTAPAPTTGTEAQTVVGNTSGLIRTGFTFAGWNTQQDGQGTSYQPGATIFITEDVSLYAIWNPIPTPAPLPSENDSVEEDAEVIVSQSGGEDSAAPSLPATLEVLSLAATGIFSEASALALIFGLLLMTLGIVLVLVRKRASQVRFTSSSKLD